MSLPRYTPGPVKVKARKPPQGHSQKTLTYKVPRPHPAHHAAPAPHHAPSAPDPLDMPVTPGSSITRRQAMRMAKNATNVRYGGQETGVNQQIAQSQQLGRDQAGWYQQYLDALKGYQTDTQNRAAATNAAVQAEANSFRTLDQGNLTAQQQAMNADAANRGATVDPRLAQDASNASVVRQALQGGLGALIAQQGLSAGNQAANLAQVVGPGQRLQAQAQNMRQQGALGEQLTGLKGQEGSFAQQFIDSLTQDEAKNILAASIASGKDLTTQQRITETTRHNKASETNTRRSIKAQRNSPSAQKTKADLAFFKKHGYYPPTGAPKKNAAGSKDKPVSGPGSLTPIKEAAVVSQINQIVSIIKSSKRPDHELRMFFANGQNPLKKVIDPRVINIAFDVARRGGLSSPNVRAAHDLGIHVGGHFKRLKTGHKLKVQGLTQPQSDTAKGIFGLQ
jgi:hypothetical protein